MTDRRTDETCRQLYADQSRGSPALWLEVLKAAAGGLVPMEARLEQLIDRIGSRP